MKMLNFFIFVYINIKNWGFQKYSNKIRRMNNPFEKRSTSKQNMDKEK